MTTENGIRTGVRQPVATGVLLALAGAKLLVHLLSNAFFNYGFFRDEFYYIACGEHLAWGYVDHPPLVAAITNLTRFLFGDSLFSIRLLPALAGAGVVFLTGVIAAELGGRRFAQALAAVAALVSPVFLGLSTTLSMNPFDLLFWAISFYLAARIFGRGENHLWYWLGLVVGIGLLNKISMLWFCGFLFLGIALSPSRKVLLNKELWIAACIAMVISLPHVLWQAANGFPLLEFMHNAQHGKMLDVPYLQFIKDQIFVNQPLALPLWLLGIVWYFSAGDSRRFRPFGVLFAGLFLFLMFNGKSRAYYLAVAYPVVFAAGSVLFERLTEKKIVTWLRPVYLAALVIGGAAIAPLALPVLPEETCIRYQQALGMGISPEEKHSEGQGAMGQYFGDMHGWDGLVDKVALVYSKITPGERAECILGFSNYGEAGAVDFLGRKYGLPGAISGHNNYYLWGPGERSGEVGIICGSEQQLKQLYREVTAADSCYDKFAMPYENRTIYLCRGLKQPLKTVWPSVKSYN